jgi:hypothetical protein
MVFCKECQRKVEDCAHFVLPLKIPSVEVFDPKVKTLAYDRESLILEIAFKNGQVWQLSGVKPEIYDELLHATLSSFLKLLAHRYKAAPVRQHQKLPATPAAPSANESCPACKRPMAEQHRTTGGTHRILWHCAACNQSFWRTYRTESVRERKPRWH